MFGKKSKEKEINLKKDEPGKIVTKETSLVDPSYNIKKLFKKGVNLMADEKLDDAIEIFEQALRIDPSNVEILMKLGYARFHLEDHLDALKVYDKILEIDVTNPEAWNLKGLVHYEQMAWYNKACFLSLLNQVPESLQALKHAIEIDVKNARKSIRDKDFANVRIEEGFKRIQEVVVLESVKQGYHTIGAIVWTTFLDKIDAEVALRKLLEKGLIIQNEKRDGLSKIPIYDLADNIAEKIGKEKIGFFGLTKKKLPKPVYILQEKQ